MAGERVGRHILVLGDDEDVRLVIGDLLDEEGYQVSHGPYLDGDTEAVLRTTPDAIVIDCNRMDLDGSVAFLRRVRAQPHLAGIPIVASTSAVKVVDQYQQEVDALGLHIIRKPFDIELLADAVAACFTDQRSTAPRG
jgi:CheY-like chemotaxis protein